MASTGQSHGIAWAFLGVVVLGCATGAETLGPAGAGGAGVGATSGTDSGGAAGTGVGGAATGGAGAATGGVGAGGTGGSGAGTGGVGATGTGGSGAGTGGVSGAGAGGSAGVGTGGASGTAGSAGASTGGSAGASTGGSAGASTGGSAGTSGIGGGSGAGTGGSAGAGGSSGTAAGGTGGAPTTTPPHSSCQSAVYQGHLYWFCTDNHDWDEAQAACEAIGGYLAVISSDGEQTFINGEAGSNQWLIGLNQKNASGTTTPGTWEWIDGSDPNTGHTNWNSGEPDDADCGAMNSNGTWRDWSCSNDENWICEIG